MIKLDIDGHLLELLPEDFGDVNITLRNPYFGFLSSYIYNLTIPYTSQVAAIFNFPSQPNRINRSKVEKPGAVIIEEMEVARGTWTAEYSGDDYLELSFEFVADEFTRTLQGKTLPDIFDEEVEPADLVAHVEETVLKTWPETDYQFPSVYNPDFYQGKNEHYSGVINHFEGTLQVTPPANSPVVPMFFLPAILKKIALAAGYTIKGKLFDDEVFKKLIVYNNYAVDNLTGIYFSGDAEDLEVNSSSSFIILFNATSDETNGYNPANGQWQVPVGGVGNYSVLVDLSHQPLDPAEVDYKYEAKLYYKPDGLGLTILAEETVDTANPLPNQDIGATYFQVQTALSANLGYFYVEIKYFDSNDNLLAGCLINTGTLVIENASETLVPDLAHSFNFKNHVPKNDCLEFFSSILHDYQQMPIFDNIGKNITLVKFADVLKEISDTSLTANILRGSIRQQQNDYNGLKVQFDFSGSDGFTNEFTEPAKVFGTFNHVIQLLFIPLGMVYLFENIKAYYIREYNEATTDYDYTAVSSIMPEYVDGAGAQEISLKLPPAVMRAFKNSNNTMIAMPGVNRSGTNAAFAMSSECPIRLMAYIGYNDSEYLQANKYPHACTTKTDGRSNPRLPFDYNAVGVIENYWKETIEFYKGRLPFELQKVFEGKEIKNLRFDKLMEFNNSLAFLEEIFITANQHEIQGEVKGYIL